MTHHQSLQLNALISNSTQDGRQCGSSSWRPACSEGI